MDTSVLQPIGRGWEVDGSTGRLRPKMLTGAIAPIAFFKESAAIVEKVSANARL